MKDLLFAKQKKNLKVFLAALERTNQILAMDRTVLWVAFHKPLRLRVFDGSQYKTFSFFE